MSAGTTTRRSFIQAGGLAAAPLAVGSPAAAVTHADLKARLARLEDQAAIRALHQSWLRQVNAGVRQGTACLLVDPSRAGLDDAVRGLTPDPAETDVIDVAEDGRSAIGRFHYVAEFESAIPRDCTLAQMAYAQGGGLIRRTERGVLTAAYVKTDDAWTIKELGFAAG